MGQKINPIGLRVALTKDWRSRWFAGKKEFGILLHEDIKIRNLIRELLKDAAIARVEIERYRNSARVTLHTARPGIVIGKKGEDIERLKARVSRETGKDILVEIREVKNPDLNAQLVAENITGQLERRVSFRRAMKRAIQMAMELGALGCKVQLSGRLGGAELARRELYREGSVPLHTLRANIDYGFSEASTTAGLIGCKVWICHKAENGEERSHAANA